MQRLQNSCVTSTSGLPNFIGGFVQKQYSINRANRLSTTLILLLHISQSSLSRNQHAFHIRLSMSSRKTMMG